MRNDKNTLREKHGFSKNDKIITIVGTVTERKGQITFVEAAINLLKTEKNNLHFVIVGARQNDYLNKIKNLITKNKLDKKIHLISETKDVFDYYLISDIFVCSSFIESFPRITLEAMAFELPIIATNVFGIPEQIDNGKEGILIPPGDPILLEEKIKLLLNDKSLAEKYAKNAYQKLESHFTVQKMLNNYEQLISKLSSTILVRAR